MRPLLIVLLLFVILTGCNRAEADDSRIRSEIAEQENALGANPRYSKENVETLLSRYEAYIALPQSEPTLTIRYLMKAGEMASLIGQYDRAIGYYDQILHDHPDNPETTKALFMKAYTLDDGLKKYDQAKLLYEQFVRKYPEDDFADDARFLLKNLGKSEEEIIKQFEAQ